MASVTFNDIRKAVSVVDVLPWLQLELQPKNDQLRGPCPLHGGDRPFAVTPGENVWYCHHPACERGGGVIELVEKVKKLPFREAAIAIDVQFQLSRKAPEGLHKVAERLLPEHDDVQALGISVDDALRLGIGYDPKGILKGRVLFPMRTIDGRLVGYSGFSETLDPKLKLPSKLF